ncbi:uncharacterized protein LOC122505377 isoform X3 [Leptopilina heterotoma]|uniref:uncharacterized protein LOC122505377 isoform X3 n=1 Tax=Leptopilina heterotoma TaxID=63436 RepID=UPI001CA9730F|nr:uncharacterized protein LOC122505377 isoform X3 [Leptopilina heterotoma]
MRLYFKIYENISINKKATVKYIRKLVSLNARRMLGGDSRTQRYSVSTTQLSRFVFILYKKLFRNKYYKFFYVFKAPGHHLEEFKRRHIKEC